MLIAIFHAISMRWFTQTGHSHSHRRMASIDIFGALCVISFVRADRLSRTNFVSDEQRPWLLRSSVTALHSIARKPTHYYNIIDYGSVYFYRRVSRSRWLFHHIYSTFMKSVECTRLTVDFSHSFTVVQQTTIKMRRCCIVFCVHFYSSSFYARFYAYTKGTNGCVLFFFILVVVVFKYVFSSFCVYAWVWANIHIQLNDIMPFRVHVFILLTSKQ